jgi:16S rRNA (adenine1518-N6/adenine1519-N6)-dimethyltransferase
MQDRHVQTKREIQALLTAQGIWPRRRLGQHFLVDGNLMRRLADSAELTTADIVLEVGAGTGGLTDLIAGRVRKIICVEIDAGLHAILAERFRGVPGVTVLLGDILESKHRLRRDVVDQIKDEALAAGQTVKLVANLPYQVATPLLTNLLVDAPSVRRLCVTVQAEVGDRLMAQPGTKAYGPLAVLTQMLCQVGITARLRPDVFWPRPAVDSVMLRLDVGKAPFDDAGKGADRDRLLRFTSLVRGAFEHRRKTLRVALRHVVNEAQVEAVCSQFDASRRPESFSIEEWLEISRVSEAAAGPTTS